MGRYLVEIQGADVYCNTTKLMEDSQDKPSNPGKKAVGEEEMLDIAEMCFIKIADELIK